jgi:streptomycin 6-kinase
MELCSPGTLAKARAGGHTKWVEELPQVLAECCEEWGLRPGRPLMGGTESCVVEVVRADGSLAVLKICLPVVDDGFRRQVRVLELADGRGLVGLLGRDDERSAMLLERLGEPMSALDLSGEERRLAVCATLLTVWRDVDDPLLLDVNEMAESLSDNIIARWERLDGPVTRRVVDWVLERLQSRLDQGPSAPTLVHGDPHRWNALTAGDGFKLVDPSGVACEPAYDLGVYFREDSLSHGGDPREVARALGELCEVDVGAVWEWGVVEQLSTALYGLDVGFGDWGGAMLESVERCSRLAPP